METNEQMKKFIIQKVQKITDPKLVKRIFNFVMYISIHKDQDSH